MPEGFALGNDRALTSGRYRDLIIVLLEPINSASNHPPSEMFAKSPTLIRVDETLRKSSGVYEHGRKRAYLIFARFVILKWRKRNDDRTRERLDEMAYRAFEEMILLAEPDVVLVCQCQTASVENVLARRLSSSIDSAGVLELVQVLNWEIIVLQGFHPSYFTGRDWSEDELSNSGIEADDRDSECLLELAFLTAINDAAGRRITGSGRDELSRRSGPVARRGLVETVMVGKSCIAAPARNERLKSAKDWWQEVITVSKLLCSYYLC